MFFNLYHRMVNPSSCRIWGLGALNHSFCNQSKYCSKYIKKSGPKPVAGWGVKTFVNEKWLVSRTVMIRCALESPHLGQPFKYLGHHHINNRKFFRDTWSWKMPQKLTKTQKFRESQLALKIKICSFAHFLRPSFTSTVRDVTIWCALDSPALCQPFKYL